MYYKTWNTQKKLNTENKITKLHATVITKKNITPPTQLLQLTTGQPFCSLTLFKPEALLSVHFFVYTEQCKVTLCTLYLYYCRVQSPLYKYSTTCRFAVLSLYVYALHELK